MAEENKEVQQPDQQQNEQEKRFTQKEVDEIVAKRLARERRKAGNDGESDSDGGAGSGDGGDDLAQREIRILTKEKLMDAGLPTKLADILNVKDKDSIDSAIETLEEIISNRSSGKAWGERHKGGNKPDPIRKAMGLDR